MRHELALWFLFSTFENLTKKLSSQRYVLDSQKLRIKILQSCEPLYGIEILNCQPASTCTTENECRADFWEFLFGSCWSTPLAPDRNSQISTRQYMCYRKWLQSCRLRIMFWSGPCWGVPTGRWKRQNFSKVSVSVIVHVQISSELTFEKFY